MLAILSNPRRRRRRKGKSGFQRVQQLTARRPRRAALRRRTLQSVRSASTGRPVERARWLASGYRRNYRPNPRGINVGAIGADLMAAVAGAGGGVALDLIMRPLPLMVKAGPLNHLVRGGISIGLGLAAQLLRFPYAGDLAKGAMTITLYNAARQYVLLPRGLGELSDDDLQALSAASEFNPSQVVGEFIPGSPAALLPNGGGMGEFLPDLAGVNYVDED